MPRFLLDEACDDALALIVPSLFAPVAFWGGVWAAWRVALINFDANVRHP